MTTELEENKRLCIQLFGKKDGPGILAHICLAKTILVSIPYDKIKTKQVSEEEDVGNREKAELCRS